MSSILRSKDKKRGLKDERTFDLEQRMLSEDIEKLGKKVSSETIKIYIEKDYNIDLAMTEKEVLSNVIENKYFHIDEKQALIAFVNGVADIIERKNPKLAHNTSLGYCDLTDNYILESLEKEEKQLSEIYEDLLDSASLSKNKACREIEKANSIDSEGMKVGKLIEERNFDELRNMIYNKKITRETIDFIEKMRIMDISLLFCRKGIDEIKENNEIETGLIFNQFEDEFNKKYSINIDLNELICRSPVDVMSIIAGYYQREQQIEVEIAKGTYKNTPRYEYIEDEELYEKAKRLDPMEVENNKKSSSFVINFLRKNHVAWKELSKDAYVDLIMLKQRDLKNSLLKMNIPLKNKVKDAMLNGMEESLEGYDREYNEAINEIKINGIDGLFNGIFIEEDDDWKNGSEK